MTSPIVRTIGILPLLAVVATACSSGPAPREIVARHAEMVHAQYTEALADVQALRIEIGRFLENPTPEALRATRDLWLAARESYGPTEAHRFYGGPIDDERGLEPLINAWPLDESFIDYVRGAPASGIIQRIDEYPVIDAALLRSLNESGGETNISTGFHAIEFLLWGQDFDVDGPGDRPATDYEVGVGPDAERRAAYLRSAAELLEENLTTVVRDWAPDVPGNFRSTWIEGDPMDALGRILLGMGSLAQAELAGERMEVALANGDQEDEHSCFSDNTHRDLILNAIGIRRVYRGGSSADGDAPSFHALLLSRAPELATHVSRSIDEAITALEALPTPFDQAISFDHPESREQVRSAIEFLRTMTDRLTEAGAALGLDRTGELG